MVQQASRAAGARLGEVQGRFISSEKWTVRVCRVCREKRVWETMCQQQHSTTDFARALRLIKCSHSSATTIRLGKEKYK
jgi:hypothetical protein